MGKMSRTKGKVGEREVAALLREHGFDARRGVQFQGGPDSPDVVGLPGFHIEVKRAERISIYPAMDQAADESKAGEVPVVFHRTNGSYWLTIIESEQFLRMCARLAELEARETAVLAVPLSTVGDGDVRHLPAPADATPGEGA